MQQTSRKIAAFTWAESSAISFSSASSFCCRWLIGLLVVPVEYIDPYTMRFFEDLGLSDMATDNKGAHGYSIGAYRVCGIK
jgi:hypothetical protein